MLQTMARELAPLHQGEPIQAATREAYGKALLELGEEMPDVCVLDADLSGSTKTKAFGKAYPERFYNCGVAEANMMGIAAGLASMGKTVFASSLYSPIREILPGAALSSMMPSRAFLRIVFSSGRCCSLSVASVVPSGHHTRSISSHVRSSGLGPLTPQATTSSFHRESTSSSLGRLICYAPTYESLRSGEMFSGF